MWKFHLPRFNCDVELLGGNRVRHLDSSAENEASNSRERRPLPGGCNHLLQSAEDEEGQARGFHVQSAITIIELKNGSRRSSPPFGK